MGLRAYIFVLVLVATVPPVLVAVLAIDAASPQTVSAEGDEDLARLAAWLIARDMLATERAFRLGTELFDLASLSPEETTGVLRMLYKQDKDIDVVVLLNENDSAVVDAVYLKPDQVIAGTETAENLPVDEGDLGLFLKNLPIEVAREKGKAFSGVYVSQRKNRVLVAGAITVRSKDGGRPWILGFERALRRVHQIVTAGVVSASSTLFVIDGGGRLVVHPDGSRFLRRESLADHPLVARLLQGTGSGSMQWMDAEGQSLTGAIQKIDSLDWAVVAQRKHPGLEDRLQVPVWAWGAWSCLAVLTLAAALFLGRRVQRIVGEMKQLSLNAEQRAAEIKRIQASILESGKLSAIGNLGAGVAHEFNNPIGGILGLTQLLLRKKKEGDPDAEFLRRIEQEAKRCKAITDNLLRFSEHQGAENREPLRLDRVAKLTVDLLQAKLESERIRIEHRVEPNVSRIWGNEGQLQRAILNVVLNAETAMPNGGVLSFYSRQEGKLVVLRVTDTGKGIPVEIQDRIFEPFFTTKDNWRGAGLGLTEVYQIVTDHGGTVSVESFPDHGATIVFRFPCEEESRPKDEKMPLPRDQD